MESNEAKKNIELEIACMEDDLKHCLKNTREAILEKLNGLDDEVLAMDNLNELLREALKWQERCQKIKGQMNGLKTALYYLDK